MYFLQSKEWCLNSCCSVLRELQHSRFSYSAENIEEIHAVLLLKYCYSLLYKMTTLQAAGCSETHNR